MSGGEAGRLEWAGQQAGRLYGARQGRTTFMKIEITEFRKFCNLMLKKRKKKKITEGMERKRGAQGERRKEQRERGIWEPCPPRLLQLARHLDFNGDDLASSRMKSNSQCTTRHCTSAESSSSPPPATLRLSSMSIFCSVSVTAVWQQDTVKRGHPREL